MRGRLFSAKPNLEENAMKYRWMLPLLLALLLLAVPALAEEAQEITGQCRIAVSPKAYKVERMTDRDWATPNLTEKVKKPTVEVTAGKDEPIYGLYVCFGSKMIPWEIQAKRNGKWETVFESEGAFAHEYAPLPAGEKAVRIRPKTDKAVIFNITELFAFGEGEAPAWVQQWQPAPEKADLLVLSGHPDDEILFFGGAIPYYAGERKMNVVVAYLTCGTNSKGTEVRRSELLNGLWEMGVRTYPVIGEFWDAYSKSLDKAYKEWGKAKVQQFVTGLLRQYKPEVAVSHDVNGEYGHGCHRVCADALMTCVESAADASAFPDSAAQWGTWQVKKLYLHLFPQNPVEMDWDQPLSAFGGRTGFEMAQAAFQWHVSQHEAAQKNPATGKYEPFTVEPRDSAYSCYRFGLAYTAVGEDTAGGDFFENVPGYEP